MNSEQLIDKYSTFFLTQDELPTESLVESKHSNQPEKEDTNYLHCGGLKNGFQVWQSGQEKKLRRMVDIRWLFDSITGAKRYHRLQMRINSENFPPSTEYLKYGDGMQIFTNHDPFGMEMEMHIYLFTVGPVCVKLFFTGYSEEERHIILQKAVQRLENCINGLNLPQYSPNETKEVNERWPQGKYQYEKELLNEPILPGVGLGDKLTFNHTIADMYKTIGGGDEDMKIPFEYFFEHGFFALAVKGEFRKDNQFHIVHIRYGDDPFGTLKTPLGISIGSPRSMVLTLMGKPQKEEGNWLIYPGIGFRFSRTAKIDLIALNPIK